MLRRNYRCLFLYGLNMGTGTRINLVNKSVSRGTFLFVMLHRREIFCCLPSYRPEGVGHRHLLVCLPHYGLRPVRLDRLCICPFQCRQRQQNISLLVCIRLAYPLPKFRIAPSTTPFVLLSWTKVHSESKHANDVQMPTLFWSGKLKDRQR